MCIEVSEKCQRRPVEYQESPDVDHPGRTEDRDRCVVAQLHSKPTDSGRGKQRPGQLRRQTRKAESRKSKVEDCQPKKRQKFESGKSNTATGGPYIGVIYMLLRLTMPNGSPPGRSGDSLIGARISSPITITMNRSLGILVLAALPSAALLDTRPGVGAPPAIDGVWYASRSFGPAVRGTLGVTESHGHWTAQIAHKTVPGVAGSWGGPRGGAASVIEFNFGADAGRLELETSAGGRPSAAAWWVQPPDSYSSNGHATPVTLTPTTVRRWSGVVRPLDDRMTFYLPVTTNADGSHSAFLRNPERNFGLFNTVERLELSGSDVTLLGRPRGAEGKAEVVVARGTVDTARGVMTIALPNAGGSYTFARVGPRQATNFYPRGFPTVPYHYRPPPLRTMAGRSIRSARSELRGRRSRHSCRRSSTCRKQASTRPRSTASLCRVMASWYWRNTFTASTATGCTTRGRLQKV